MNISVNLHEGRWYIRLLNRWHWSISGNFWTDRYEDSKAFASEKDARQFLDANRTLIEAAS